MSVESLANIARLIREGWAINLSAPDHFGTMFVGPETASQLAGLIEKQSDS